MLLAYADIDPQSGSNLLLSYLIHLHNTQPKRYEESNKRNPGRRPLEPHEYSWYECDCLSATWIRELAEVEIMDEDSPNNMLSQDEHIALFNECKLKDSKSPTEDLIATRQLMKKAIAVLRTKVQAKTVILNERREKGNREEKLKIKAADKLYSPALRPDEKASESEIKMMAEINADDAFKSFLKLLPNEQYKAAIKLCKQIGVEETKTMFGYGKKTGPTVPSEDNSETSEVSEDDKSSNDFLEE